MLGGRGTVVDEVGDLLRQASCSGNGGGALGIEGAAGIGKTALLARVRRSAGDVQVVEVWGTEAERTMPFAGVTQLCAPVAHALPSLAAHQRSLVERALGWVPAADTDPLDVMALGLALLALLGEASRARPLLVLVDDAHWLDASSRQVLEFVARRLAGTSVVFVAAQRTDTDGLRLPRSVELSLLGEAEAIAMLVDADVERHVAAAIASRVDRLPLLLQRVAASLTSAQRHGEAPLPDPLPVGSDLEATYRDAIEGLGGEDHEAVVVLAALGEHHDVRRVDPALTDRLVAAERAGLVHLERGVIGFVHPVARSAVYWSAPAELRRRAHRRLASRLPPDDPATLWHRSAATVGFDDELAEALIVSGTASARRGAAASAVVAFQRAIELAERSDLAHRARVEGASAALAAGAHRTAELFIDHAEAERKDTATGLLRAQLALATGAMERARELFVVTAGAADESGDAAAAAAARLQAAAVSIRMLDFEGAGQLLDAIATDAPLRTVRRRAALGAVIGLRRRSVGADAVLDALGAIEQADGRVEDLRFRAEVLTLAIAIAGDDRSLLGAADEMHRRHGDAIPSMMPSLLIARAAHLNRSDLVGATAAATEALELADAMALDDVATVARMWLANAQAGRCAPETPQTCAAVEAMGTDLSRVTSHLTLAFFHLGLEQYDEAFDTLMVLDRWADGELRSGMFWHADLAEAALRLGHVDVAQRQARFLDEVAATFPLGWTIAAAERVNAQLIDDLDEAEARFVRAIETFDEHGLAIAGARARLLFGERLRRGRRRAAAREVFTAARRSFERAGMTVWSDRCARELALLGVATDPVVRTAHAVLSSQELQVARWVVAGESNREIAGRLFLSPRTVETHVSAIYRKLGIRGRTALIRLSRTDESLTDAALTRSR